jgi:hypothetical protein
MMQEQQGTQFDPLLLTTFFTVLEEIHELAQQNPDQPEEPHQAAYVTPLGGMETVNFAMVPA